MEMREFAMNIELINGEPFVCLQNLIDMLEGSISKESTQFDFVMFSLANQLKQLKNQSIENTQGDENAKA
jgi:hypothetical protein